MSEATEAIEAGAAIVRPNLGHEKWPAPSDWTRFQRPSRQIHDDWSVAKPREECIPFTYSLATPRDDKDVKAQERFVKKLGTLRKKEAAGAKRRAKGKKS